jgi:transposase
MGGMPWKEHRIVDEREAFVRSYLREATPMAELCREYGISRKTGYKWVQRFHDGGMPALMDRSRAPRRRPHAMSEEVAEAIVALREKRPTWGARKLRAMLERKHPDVPWPAPSTIAALLSRHGLVLARRRRRRTPLSTQPLAVAREPNDVWCADYKGKFRVYGRYCHPFTITDALSRFVLCCHDTASESFLPTKLVCERIFREHGLPLRIRTDNGSPFASRAVGGLSKLSVSCASRPPGTTAPPTYSSTPSSCSKSSRPSSPAPTSTSSSTTASSPPAPSGAPTSSPTARPTTPPPSSTPPTRRATAPGPTSCAAPSASTSSRAPAAAAASASSPPSSTPASPAASSTTSASAPTPRKPSPPAPHPTPWTPPSTSVPDRSRRAGHAARVQRTRAPSAPRSSETGTAGDRPAAPGHPPHVPVRQPS